MDDPAPRSGRPQAARAGGTGIAESGSVDLRATPGEVFRVLLDPAALSRVIPGCHGLDAAGEHRYRADVSIGIGLVEVRYKAEVVLSEIDAPRSLRLAGSGQSALGTARGDGRLRLEAREGGTRLHYEYASEVGGRVAAIGARMLAGAARIVLKRLFANLEREAGGARAPEGWWRRLLRSLGVSA
jgi:2-furoyl-CoA dehydrogenase large subunit